MNRLDQLFYFGEDQIEEDLLFAQLRAFDYLLFHPQNDQLQDYRLVSDDSHRVVSFTHLDACGQPSASSFGYVTAQCQYRANRRGKVSEVTLHYFDAQGHPCLDRLGHSQTIYSLDAKRRVTQVDWRDADGYGRSRDNLSRLIFEWDDEIVRVSYFDNCGQLSSRFQYVFDEARQYVRLRMGLDETGALTTDDDGGNGSWIERDPHSHRPVALWNINISRQRIQTVDGVAYWRLQFVTPRVQRLMYFNANGVAMTNHEGVYGFESEYNQYGSQIRETNLDAQGRPMPNLFGVVRFEFDHDDLGRIIEVRAWGPDDRPAVSADGIHRVRQVYDDDPEARTMGVMKFDAEGHLVTSGVHRPTFTCFISPTEHWFRVTDAAWQPLSDQSGNIQAIRRLFDAQGRPALEEKIQLDDSGPSLLYRPIVREGTISGYRSEYDDKHRIISTTAFGVDGRVTTDDDGVACYQTHLDRWGRVIRQTSLDAHFQPIPNSLGDCSTGFEYDDEGNVTWVSIGPDGNPHVNLRGYTYYSLEKDSFGRDVREFWYDAQRRPFVSSHGDSGLMMVYRPNIKDVIFLDANGDPHENDRGAAMIHYLYDDQEREIYVVRYNLDGDKVLLPEGAYAIQTVHHDDQPNHHTLIFLDADDQPTENLRGYAYSEQWLDDRGNIVREMRYDVDHLPAVDDDGVCGNTFTPLDPAEPNGSSELVGQLDSDGNYVVDATGLVFWRVDSDVFGRVVRKTWFDIDKRPCRDASGTYGVEFRFGEGDLEGDRPIDRLYLNPKGKPMDSIWGFARQQSLFDAKGQERRIYYDQEGVFVQPQQIDEYEDY